MLSFNQAYFATCQALELALQQRLNRPLEVDERLGIWNAGSLMMVEALERSLTTIDDLARLSQELRHTTELFRPRFEECRQKSIERLIHQGILDPHIHDQIAAAQTVYDVLWIVEMNAD